MYDLLLSGGTIITCNNSFDIIEDGIIGVKVWIYKGELMAKDVDKEKKERVKSATTSKN